MHLTTLAILYAIVGLGAAGAALAARQRRPISPLDAALLLTLWPLYGPFLLLQSTPPPSPTHSTPRPERTPPEALPLLEALHNARFTPLAALLPNEDTLWGLVARVETATRKRDEIDRLLLLPEFSEHDAQQRAQALDRTAPNSSPATVAHSRLQNIRRLAHLRQRFATELEHLHDLLAQLRTQTELVRLTGDLDDDSRHLIQGIVAHIEGLDAVLEDDAHPAP